MSDFDIAKQRARLSPEKPALYFRGSWYSYGEMNQRAERLAKALAQQGVQQGDRVSILAFNHLAHFDLILATAKLGFIYSPLNYRLSQNEQHTLLDYLQPRCLFVDSQHQKLLGGQQTALSLEHYEAWLKEADDLPTLETPQLDPEDIQMMLLTGGTTGLPKAAMQSYRQGFQNVVNTVLSWGLQDSDCCIQATPCFHAAVNALSIPLYHLGGRIVLQEQFDARGYLDNVEKQQASLLFLVPTMYKMLSDHPDFSQATLPSVRWAISGGAPCPEPVRRAFVAKGIRFKQGYGLTEAGVNCFAMSLEDAASNPLSVGTPVLYSQAVIRNAQGEALQQGEVGELTLKGPHLFSGYYKHSEASAQALRKGWLWTGDLARQDERGFFYIVGRRKDMFISGGENIYPVEIERLLDEHPAVSECAVLGVPDATWGECGLAAVVLTQPLNAGDVKAYLQKRLARYKVPKHIRFYQSLPKSGAGKILKTQLAEDFTLAEDPTKEQHALP